MKRYCVYGSDTIKALKSFDSLDDAKEFCRKGLRKWSKSVTDSQTGRYLYKAWKNNDGKIIEKNY